MRYLFLILICSGVAWGQTTQNTTPLSAQDWDSLTRIVWGLERPSVDDTTGERILDIITYPKFISLWHEWEDSCWADSTYGQIPCPGPPSLLYFECKGWTHRYPNDLGGFMEFIERRSK